MFSIRRPGSMKVAFGGGSMCPPGAGMGGSYGGNGNGSGGIGAGSGASQNIRFNSVYDDLSEGTIIEQFMPVDPRRLHRIWRRIYLQDPVAGAGIDLYKDIPWSSWDLQGVGDPSILKIYQDCLNALGMVSLMPELTGEFLVMGKITLHMLMNESKGYFDYAIPCDPDYIRVTPIPVPGFHPKIDLLPSPEMRRWATSVDPRDVEAINAVGQYAEELRMGRDIPLPQANTIYVPRKVSPYDTIGASIYTRIIMFVAYEKHLVNATVSAAKRRAGRIRHLKLGIEETWEPTPEQIDSISALFMQADEDPVGAIVATRTGVEMNETGGSSPQDMLKISDEASFLAEGKLGALGISASFLNGDANFSNLDTQLSVFLERVRAHREFMTQRVLLDICRRLAIKHDFRKTKPNRVAHHYRVAATGADDAEFELPDFVFTKALRPVADRDYLDILQMVQQSFGVPIPVREAATAAGLNFDTIADGLETDFQDRQVLRDYQKKMANAGIQQAGGEGGGMGGGGMFGGGGDMFGGGGGDMFGGGGDMGMGGEGGMDLGTGGELPGAGSIDTPDLGGGGGDSSPLTAAQFKGAHVGNPYGTRSKPWEPAFRAFPLWDHEGRLLGLTQAEAYKSACAIQPGKRYTIAEYRRVARTGNAKKDQVLDYVLFRSGVLETCSLTQDVAQDLHRWAVAQRLPPRELMRETHVLREVVKGNAAPVRPSETLNIGGQNVNLSHAALAARQQFSAYRATPTLLTGAWHKP